MPKDSYYFVLESKSFGLAALGDADGTCMQYHRLRR